VGPSSNKRRWVPTHTEQKTGWVPVHTKDGGSQFTLSLRLGGSHFTLRRLGGSHFTLRRRLGGSHFTLSRRLCGSQFTLSLRLGVSQFTLIGDGVGLRGRVDALRREQACRLYKDVLHRKNAIRLHYTNVNVISFTSLTNVQLCLRRFSRS